MKIFGILRDVPADVDARIVENRRLSSDYNVLVFHAPSIAAQAAPGQFVMIKTAGAGDTPLLRRPFSIFEIVRAADGTPAGFSIINKKIGTGTSQLFDAEAGQRPYFPRLHVPGAVVVHMVIA